MDRKKDDKKSEDKKKRVSSTQADSVADFLANKDINTPNNSVPLPTPKDNPVSQANAADEEG